MTLNKPTLQQQLAEVTGLWASSVQTRKRPPIEAAELMTQFLGDFRRELDQLGKSLTVRLADMSEALHRMDAAINAVLTGEDCHDPEALSRTRADVDAHVWFLLDLLHELNAEVDVP